MMVKHKTFIGTPLKNFEYEDNSWTLNKKYIVILESKGITISSNEGVKLYKDNESPKILLNFNIKGGNING